MISWPGWGHEAHGAHQGPAAPADLQHSRVPSQGLRNLGALFPCFQYQPGCVCTSKLPMTSGIASAKSCSAHLQPIPMPIHLPRHVLSDQICQKNGIAAAKGETLRAPFRSSPASSQSPSKQHGAATKIWETLGKRLLQEFHTWGDSGVGQGWGIPH